MKNFLCFFSLCGALLCAGPASAAPTPDMFAQGMELEAGGDEGFYEVTLPLAVYQGVARKDLGDLRVFNSQGQIVPHALRRPAAQAMQKKTSTRTVPFFPVTANAAQKAGDLTLHVERDSHGTIIDVRSADQPDTSAERRTIAFLIDAGAAAPPIDGLTLAWSDPDTDFLGQMTVEASSDLTAWRHLTTATIARLAFQGRRLQQESLTFPRQTLRYLRLTWPADQPGPALSAVTAITNESSAPAEPERQWLAVQGVPAGGPGLQYAFDLKGFVPVDRVRIKPAFRNFLATARLLSADAPTAPLREQWQGLVYRIDIKGQSLASPDISLRPTLHRFWLLDVADREISAGAAAPTIEFGWHPDRLVFLAQGPGPFQLAYGSAVTGPAAFELDALLSRSSLAGGGPIVPRNIAPGPPHPLGGEEKLHAPRSLPWKKYLLWAVLLAGVLMIGWMSVLLYRQLHAGGGEQKRE
jgi:hypothetical protein